MFSLQKSFLPRKLFCFSLITIALLTSPGGNISSLHADETNSLAPAPILFTIGSFPFTRPPTWQWVIPSSAMRKVQLSIPSTEGGDNADVSFFTFGSGQGGSVQANVERWAKQFTSPDGTPVKATTESRTIAATPVTFVSARGAFSAGMMDATSGPKSDYALRGAIIENPNPNGTTGDIFVKMTGPEPLVLKSSAAFDAMITKACQEAGAQ